MLTATLQGHLDTYRFCDEVWTFIIKDVKFKLDNTNTVEAERVKIVACQSKEKTQRRGNNGETRVDNLALHACKVLDVLIGSDHSKQADRGSVSAFSLVTQCSARLIPCSARGQFRQVIACWPPQPIKASQCCSGEYELRYCLTQQRWSIGLRRRKEDRNLMIPMQICNLR